MLDGHKTDRNALRVFLEENYQTLTLPPNSDLNNLFLLRFKQIYHKILLILKDIPENKNLTRELLYPLIRELQAYGQTILGSLFDWPMLPFDPANVFLQLLAKKIEMITTPECYLVRTDDIKTWLTQNSSKATCKSVYFYSIKQIYYFDWTTEKKLTVLDASIEKIFPQQKNQAELATLEVLLQLSLATDHVLVPCYLLKMEGQFGAAARTSLKQTLKNNLCFIWAESSLYFIDRDGQELVISLSTKSDKESLEKLFGFSLRRASAQDLQKLYWLSGCTPMGMSKIQLMMPYITAGKDLSCAMRLTSDFNPQKKSVLGQMVYAGNELIYLPHYIERAMASAELGKGLFSSIRYQSWQLEYYILAANVLSKFNAKAVNYDQILHLLSYLLLLNAREFSIGRAMFGIDLSMAEETDEGKSVQQLSANCFRSFFAWIHCLEREEKNWFGSLSYKELTAQSFAVSALSSDLDGINLLAIQNFLFLQTKSGDFLPIIRSHSNAIIYDQLRLHCHYKKTFLYHEEYELLKQLIPSLNAPNKNMLKELFDKMSREDKVHLVGQADVSQYEQFVFIRRFNEKLLSNRLVPTSPNLEQFLNQIFVHAKYSYLLALSQPHYAINNNRYLSQMHSSYVLQEMLKQFQTEKELFNFFRDFLNLSWEQEELLYFVDLFNIELMKSLDYWQLLQMNKEYDWFVRCIFAHFALKLEVAPKIIVDIFSNFTSKEYICLRLKTAGQLLSLLEQLHPPLRMSTVRFLLDQHLLDNLLINSEDVEKLCQNITQPALIDTIKNKFFRLTARSEYPGFFTETAKLAQEEMFDMGCSPLIA